MIESSYRESNTAGGYTQYEYEYSGDYEEDLLGSGLKANLFTKTKRVITDGNSTYKYDGSFIYTDGNDTYEVKSGVIVVTHTSSGASYSSSEKREVTLNENKSYKSVKSTRTETEDGQTSTWVSNYTFAYTANARLVVGNKDEYVEVQPIVVTIVWGEGKANGTLNSAPDSYVQLSDGGVSGYGIDYNYISVNAPSVPGKVIVGWKVNGVDVGSYHNFTPTANITITAVWEDED
ncbi:hypothetical protein FACS1894121_1470 [Bacteroidia bacterium]|nr:hypothetical protein FACS1894121_1470 [Bacteroidia bacterium]